MFTWSGWDYLVALNCFSEAEWVNILGENIVGRFWVWEFCKDSGPIVQCCGKCECRIASDSILYPSNRLFFVNIGFDPLLSPNFKCHLLEWTSSDNRNNCRMFVRDPHRTITSWHSKSPDLQEGDSSHIGSSSVAGFGTSWTASCLVGFCPAEWNYRWNLDLVARRLECAWSDTMRSWRLVLWCIRETEDRCPESWFLNIMVSGKWKGGANCFKYSVVQW